MGEEELLIHELVGAGGFAQVFRASWRPKAGGGSVRTVAVKQLRDLPHQPAPLRAFCSEISLMQGFAHPNVLGLLGVCAGADGSLRMARHATARRRTPRAAAAAAPPPPPPPPPHQHQRQQQAAAVRSAATAPASCGSAVTVPATCSRRGGQVRRGDGASRPAGAGAGRRLPG